MEKNSTFYIFFYSVNQNSLKQILMFIFKYKMEKSLLSPLLEVFNGHFDSI